ncbi:unnamed protein product [Arabidopsis halleri]
MAETLLSFGVEKLWDLLVRESKRFLGVKEQYNEVKEQLGRLRGFLKDADAKKHTSATVRKTVEEIKEIVYDAEDIIETFLLKEEAGKTSGIWNRVKRLALVIVDRRDLGSDLRAISKRIDKVIHDMQILGVQQVMVNERYTQSLQEGQREMRQKLSSDYEDHLVGLEKAVEQLVGYLVKEDSSQVVSITGIGGIGKTTLARKVFNRKTIQCHFAGLAWVFVTQKFSRKHVWQMILRKLRPEYKVLEMLENELLEKLFQVLETQNTLIVLDDIWTEDDWDIIKPMFPPKKEYKIDEEMEELGKKMIKHCSGLPLAIKVLGGLLAVQHTLSEWKRVCANIKSHFNDSNNTPVDQILSLSYEELPISLKHCFLYLARFQEDYAIDVRELSYYWAAEGIPKSRYNDEATIREVADEYIEELVKRNMVISERDIHTSRFETCRLHEMVREICLYKAKEENFLKIIDASSITSTLDSWYPSEPRRLVIHSCDHTFLTKNPKIRSLLLRGSMWMPSGLCFTKVHLMRVLDLYEVEFEGGKLPSSIGKLIHLRYLSLYMAKVSHLPSSLENLTLLLYLNLKVKAGSPLNVPNILKEMKELRYLWLPDEMHDKTKLELGNLINLETLENFSTKHSRVRDLHCLTKLETLSILFNGKGCTKKTLSSSLSELRHLENLTIDGYTSDEEGLIFDCVHLKHLQLSIYMPRLPDVQYFPSNLTTINLKICHLEEDPMPILEKLLHLSQVKLSFKSFCGKRMVCSGGGFPKLHMLSIWGLLKWEEWIVEDGSMPLLHTLSISECDKLKEFPNGLRFIYSLVDLIMGKEWKERLSKGGVDYYKVQHIPFVKFTGGCTTETLSSSLGELRHIDHRAEKSEVFLDHAMSEALDTKRKENTFRSHDVDESDSTKEMAQLECISVFSCNDSQDVDETHFMEAILKELHERGVTPLTYNLSGRENLNVEMLNRSSVGIMVFSNSYVCSKQSLDHLVAIMEHWKAKDLVIIPIYFKVTLQHICGLKGKSEAAFLHLQSSVQEDRVQKWKMALAEIESIDGHEWTKGTEVMLAEEVVRNACLRLYLKNSKNLVRILALLNQSQPSDAEIVGIWGMAGIGLRQMRDDLFSKIFGEEKLSIGASDIKPSFMRGWFQEKTILLVLDDVSNARDAEAVVGGFSWFSHGHRIILTSRRKQVLVQCRVKEPYEIQKLCEFESSRLCKQYLNGENVVISELMSCSSGIPLALNVLGSSVSKQHRSIMKEHLQSLRRNPPTQIQDAFRKSFDGLDENEKNIFLDLACFFAGENKDHVVQLLDACGFLTYLGICDLIDESLISVVDDKIEMPVPFQDIGRFIVHEEGEDPCERSRLWDSKDIADVLTRNSGTEAIEGIFLDASDLNYELSPTVFSKMYRLRLLKLSFSTPGNQCKLSLSQGLYTLPDELRLLHWENYPLECLPQKFNPENLVEVNMPYSNMEKLWEGKKNLEKLKRIKLSHSRNLTDIMVLSEALNLEHIDLEGCISLVDVSTSIPSCGKLVSLNLKNCSQLQSLPAMFGLTSLKLLRMSGCSEFEEIQDFAPNLKELYLAGTAIKELPLSIENLTELIMLDLENCTRLQKLPNGISNLRSMVKLKLSGCTSLDPRSMEATLDDT